MAVKELLIVVLIGLIIVGIFVNIYQLDLKEFFLESLLGLVSPNKYAEVESKKNLINRIPREFKVCLDCHDTLVQKLQEKNTHLPAVMGQCGVCHVVTGHPGASAQYTLPLNELCFTCHNRIWDKQNQYQHRPFELGKCADCHDPHGSPNQYNLRLVPQLLCNTCHNMGIRYGKYKVQHPPFATNQCLGCHYPHSSPYPKNLRAPVNELCNTCHFATLPGQYALVKHPPFRDGRCIECHHPHASDNMRMLRKPIPYLCLNCHDNERQIGWYKKMHPYGEKFPDRAEGGSVTCLSCHHPHGTGNPRMWRRPGNYLCFGCHRNKMEPMR
ncbi:doubled CXXCH domain-containing protein [Carboxydocella sporoproducens DSM 16521]|uniref:Doubled CXXCH domain-containing protein n=2 Tax=Carboxydocella TaxID=178898 RepID=A0A1T4LMN6_9FIRM|nr:MULTISPECIES: cytochrome c3 family protein [Carboxydocella]AVX20522.1 doubled CXXCH domain-containing protein [Carboxydocella thermautotrophica]SJZ55778.1 doubled CXXCH domain-containing protein [Carboxydocella sporoproducens DSM 16521]